MLTNNITAFFNILYKHLFLFFELKYSDESHAFKAILTKMTTIFCKELLS